jgi:uncharacterized protein YeaO (DUF488 family)
MSGRDDDAEPGEYASPPCFMHELDPAWTGSAPRIGLRRAYEPPGPDDGWRVLVDRLWPRGIRRSALPLDEWLTAVAPSSALRRWYGHDPARWQEFRRRYTAELAAAPEAVEPLLARCRQGPVTLVFGARDVAHSDAVVLRDYLLGRLGNP